MEIPLGKNHKLSSSTHEWTTYKKTKKGWYPIGHYTNIETAISQLSEKRIREVDGLVSAQHVRDAIIEIKMDAYHAYQCIKKACSGS